MERLLEQYKKDANVETRMKKDLSGYVVAIRAVQQLVPDISKRHQFCYMQAKAKELSQWAPKLPPMQQLCFCRAYALVRLEALPVAYSEFARYLVPKRNGMFNA